MPGIAGSLWVDGEYLHFFDGEHEYRYHGTSVGFPAGAQPGSIWIQITYVVHYIDAIGEERVIVYAQAGATVPTAVPGSLWVEHLSSTSGVLKLIDNIQRIINIHADQAHSDIAMGGHMDVADHDDHTNVAFHDTDYGDWFQDTVAHDDHSDVTDHGDGFHDDIGVHEDHNDVEAPDIHTDVPSVVHIDQINSHADSGPHDNYADHFDHIDTPEDDTPHGDSHINIAHEDAVGHSDVAHIDLPELVV